MKFQICEEQGVSTLLNYNFKLHVHADVHIMTTGSFLEKKKTLETMHFTFVQFPLV